MCVKVSWIKWSGAGWVRVGVINFLSPIWRVGKISGEVVGS